MPVANFQVYQNSQNALSLANAITDLYAGVKKVLGDTVFWVVVAIAILPIRLLFLIILRNLKKGYHPSRIQLTTKNYSRYYQTYQSLGAEIDKLNKVVKFDEKKAPWLVRGVLRDIKNLNSITIDYYNDLSKVLDDSDDAITEENDMLFKQVSSQALWKNRTKAYSYKL